MNTFVLIVPRGQGFGAITTVVSNVLEDPEMLRSPEIMVVEQLRMARQGSGAIDNVVLSGLNGAERLLSSECCCFECPQKPGKVPEQ